MEIHHIGVATQDADSLVRLYTDLLDGDVAHKESFDGMDIVFIDFGSGYFELLEPHSDGVLSEYLSEQGPGIHHVAFQAADIDAAIAHAETLGVNPIDETPRDGAWGHKVAFLHPGSLGGVLVEFVQH